MVVVFKLLKKWCDFFETFIVHSANHNYIQVKRFPRKCFIICQHIKEPDKWCINYTFFFSFSSHKTRLAQSKALLTCTCEHNFMLFFSSLEPPSQDQNDIVLMKHYWLLHFHREEEEEEKDRKKQSNRPYDWLLLMEKSKWTRKRFGQGENQFKTYDCCK